MQKKINLNERIFVAGSNGMDGSAICRALKKNNYGKKEFGGTLLTPTRKELDLNNSEQVKRWFEINKPTITILAAAKVGGIFANSSKPTDFLLENLKIQNNVIESSWLSGVKRLLFLGSSCIYPKFASQPIKEECLLTGEIEETNQWYAIAKIAGIKLCAALRKQHNFDAFSLMPCNLYGPNDNYDPMESHVFASFIKKFKNASSKKHPSVTCWGSGSPLREFLHVDDLASATIYCLENWDPEFKKFGENEKGDYLSYLNVGTGKEISIKELAITIAKLSGYKGEIKWDLSKPDGTPRKLLNIERIKKLGWEPTINLMEGIERTLSEID